MKLPALTARTLVIVGGAVLLTTGTAYGIGYWKGSRVRQATPVTSVTDRQTDKDETARTTSRADIYGSEDILETRLRLPDIVMEDGSVESRTRIRREVAKTETAALQQESTSKVKERIVEVKVPVPCPAAQDALVSPFAASQPPKVPRFMAGPSIARDFDLSKTVLGVGGAVRVGPLWLRLFADTHPQVGGAVEVSW